MSCRKEDLRHDQNWQNASKGAQTHNMCSKLYTAWKKNWAIILNKCGKPADNVLWMNHITVNCICPRMYMHNCLFLHVLQSYHYKFWMHWLAIRSDIMDWNCKRCNLEVYWKGMKSTLILTTTSSLNQVSKSIESILCLKSFRLVYGCLQDLKIVINCMNKNILGKWNSDRWKRSLTWLSE